MAESESKSKFQHLLDKRAARGEDHSGYHHTPVHVNSNLYGVWQDAVHLFIHPTHRSILHLNDPPDLVLHNMFFRCDLRSKTGKSGESTVEESDEYSERSE